MAGLGHKEEAREFSEERASLFRITLAPLLWALHFVAAYASTAVYCAKWGEGAASIWWFRVGTGVATVLVLAAIAWLGWRAWRQWDADMGRTAREMLRDIVEEHEERHQFLGHAALLLAIISFVAVVYTALPVVLIGDCR